MKTYLNTFLLFALAMVVTGAGYYVTEVRQPERLQHYTDLERLARMEHARVAQLLVEAEQSAERADAAVRRWQSRYRYVPTALSTPDVVDYLKALTPDGFEAFDITLEQTHRSADVSHHRFSVDGTAEYAALYDFIWKIENQPEFYRIQNLEMARTTVFDGNRAGSRGREMVRFSLTLDAFFAGLEGMSTDRDSLAAVPADYMPIDELVHNSFYPLVRERVRSGGTAASNLVDVEHASLVSIAGNRAIFQDGNTQFIVYEGSSVQYGTIERIDPINVMVRARLVKDGVTQVVDVQMENSRPSYRQAEGSTQLVPIETQNRNR